MTNIKCFAIFQLICAYLLVTECKLEELYRWKTMSFDFLPVNIQYDSAYMEPYNNVPMSVSHYKQRLFITVPRRAPAVPAVLYFIPDNLTAGSSPKLTPYPDYAINELHPELKPDDTRFVSIYRTRVDECGRLWFVCTGALEQNGTVQIQPPSVWVIDLDYDSIVRRYEIPASIVTEGRGIISLKVDVDKDKCDEAYAYISDFLHQKLYVYSYEKDHMWSFSHTYLNYELELTNYDFDGFKYQWFDGVFSVTLARRQADGYRKAFFHPMASNSEFEVSTRVLQNETLSTMPDEFQSRFVKLGNRGANTQSTMHDFDERTGVVFYALIAKSAVGCWNSNSRVTPDTQGIVAQDNATMNYPVDLSVDSGTVWALTNTLPRYIYGQLDRNQYNYRIWRGDTKALIKGTVCEPRQFKPVKKVEDAGPR